MPDSYINISNSTIINGKKIDLEKLSQLEHDQWWNWSLTLGYRMSEAIEEGKTLKEFASEQIEKWSVNWIPYEELNEETKEFDREYARKVLKVIEK